MANFMTRMLSVAQNRKAKWSQTTLLLCSLRYQGRLRDVHIVLMPSLKPRPTFSAIVHVIVSIVIIVNIVTIVSTVTVSTRQRSRAHRAAGTSRTAAGSQALHCRR